MNSSAINSFIIIVRCRKIESLRGAEKSFLRKLSKFYLSRMLEKRDASNETDYYASSRRHFILRSLQRREGC